MKRIQETLGLFSDDGRSWGLLAEFLTVDSLREACAKVRAAGYTKFDAHSPIPVHGIDEAMGIRMSPIPWIVLVGAIFGVTGGLALQWFTNAMDYPFLISGKPLFSFPPAFPIIFECAVLLSATCAVGALFIICGWPQWYHPLFASARFRRMTTDRYFISIEVVDPLYDRDKTRVLLDQLGASAIEEIVN